MSSSNCKKGVPYPNSNILVQNNDQKRLITNSQTIQCSTLSLHIAAYEDSFEGASQHALSKTQSDGYFNYSTFNRFKSMVFGSTTKVLKNENSHSDILCFQISNEVPRQQREATNEPEVMQFKASQKLSDPNNGTLDKKGQHFLHKKL